jgi:hypothetical protein
VGVYRASNAAFAGGDFCQVVHAGLSGFFKAAMVVAIFELGSWAATTLSTELAGSSVLWEFLIVAGLVGASGALAGQVERGLTNWENGKGFFVGLGRPDDLLFDASLAVLAHGLLGLFSSAPNCFPPETLVATEAGLRPIAGIEAGERVWAYDFSTGVWKLCEVECRHDAVYEGPLVTLDLGVGEVTATAYHPFWVIKGQDLAKRSALRHVDLREDQGASLPGRWVNSHDLREGDVVVLREAGPVPVRRVWQHHERTSVCNLTIRGLHTFVVGENQVLVHNTSGSANAPRNDAGFPKMSRAEASEMGLTERDAQWPWRGLHESEGHHPLMQGEEFQDFWQGRGLSRQDVEGFVKPMDTDIHRAISEAPRGGQPWWDQQLLSRIAEREAALGRTLTKPEVLEEANNLLRRVEGFSPD